MDDSEIVETGTVTVTVQLAFMPLPSFAVAVMVALPSPTAFTTPSAETVAMLLLLVDHVRDWFVAVEGLTVAVS